MIPKIAATRTTEIEVSGHTHDPMVNSATGVIQP